MDDDTRLSIRTVLGQLTQLLSEATLLIHRRNLELERKDKEREEREQRRQSISNGVCPECDGKLEENQHGGGGLWICEECGQRYP